MSDFASLLTTKRLGRQAKFVNSTGSTNRDVSEAAAAGAAEGYLVAADDQTDGRGRLDHKWFSPPGVNLYWSLLLRPQVPPDRAASLPLVMGLAVAEAFTTTAPGFLPMIKWPNDILVNGKKLCGILCEMQLTRSRVDSIIAGIGINVNITADMFPKDIAGQATSLAIELGRVCDRQAVLAAVLNTFEPLYDEWCAFGFTALAAQVNVHDILRDRPVSIVDGGRPISGIGAGIRADGALMLSTKKGLIPVYSGEAHVTQR